jgi:hypothetical protein
MSTFRSITASIYPWDLLGDPLAAEKAAALGIDRVTLPAVYHAVRATTVRHPEHRVIETSRTGMFTAWDPNEWPDSALRATDGSRWLGVRDSFGLARDQLQGVGLFVDAWVVLMHADGVEGPAGSEFLVRNAFGDNYEFALCPNGEGVREYATNTVRNVAINSGVEGMMLEACGAYGFTHLSKHDKTDGSGLTEVDRALLSLCFCQGCRKRQQSSGLDDDELAAMVVSAVGSTPPVPVAANSGPLTAALGDIFGDKLDSIIAFREETNSTLRNALITEARGQGIKRISFQASADPWSTGFSASVLDASPDIQVAIIDSTGPSERAAARLGEMGDLFDSGSTHPLLGAFTGIDATSSRDAFQARWQAFADAGASELHLYHAGLASTSALAEAGAALRALS